MTKNIQTSAIFTLLLLLSSTVLSTNLKGINFQKLRANELIKTWAMDPPNAAPIVTFATKNTDDKFKYILEMFDDQRHLRNEIRRFATKKEDGFIQGCTKNFEIKVYSWARICKT